MDYKEKTISVPIDYRLLENWHFYDANGNDWRKDLTDATLEFKNKHHIIDISETFKIMPQPSNGFKYHIGVNIKYRDYVPDEILSNQLLYQIENIL